MNTEHIAIEVAKDEHYRSPYLKGLKENWPSLAKDFRHYCHVFGPKQGDLWIWTSPEGQKFFHCIMDEDSQHVGDHKTDKLHFFRLSVKKLKKAMESEKVDKVTLPVVAFNFKNEELAEAHKILKDVFADTNAEVKFN